MALLLSSFLSPAEEAEEAQEMLPLSLGDLKLSPRDAKSGAH